MLGKEGMENRSTPSGPHPYDSKQTRKEKEKQKEKEKALTFINSIFLGCLLRNACPKKQHIYFNPNRTEHLSNVENL